MGSLSFWRVARWKAYSQRAVRLFYSPLRFGFQERNQFIRWSELTLTKARWDHRLNGLEFLTRISANINLRRREIAMSQPQRNLSDIFSCLKYNHCTGMSKHMW